MTSPEYVDCELFLTGRNHARLSVEGREYSGRPTLDASLERRLLEVELEPARYGAELFDALFQEGDGLLAGYRESLTVARREDRRLRLRLHIAEAAATELHGLHWELLYDPGRKIAFGRSQETAFSRYLGVSFEPGQPVASRPRLLVVIACPRDLTDYGLPEIDRSATSTALEAALSPLAELMSWETLEGPATVERIRDRLVAGKFHALHLVAHGLLLQDEGVAQLVLETADGSARPVDEGVFSEVFDGQRDLRLISLIACHGGVPSGRDPFSGLGPELIRRGLPAVVAMQQQISLGGAVRFTEHFYRNLARSGRIDAATNEARMQLYLDQETSPEWGTPALYMRLAEGQLWRSSSSVQASGNEAQDVPVEDVEPESTESDEGARQASPVVKTLVVSELVGQGGLAEALGDERMAEIFHRYDRLARDLLNEHQGLQAELASGFLMLFERPLPAVRWALAFHAAIAKLSAELGAELAFRVGIHLGEVVLIEAPAEGGGRVPKLTAVEGQARPIAGRLASLAEGGRTLLSSAAFDLARRSVVGAAPDDKLCWLAHGEYVLEGFTSPLAVFEVGIEGSAPLTAPVDTQNARRAAGDQTIVGWRPGIGLEVPQRPKWVLEKKLSEGGFGEVWLAGHEKLRQQRVFKFCFEAERLRALQREITLFRLLKEELGDRDDIARILDWNFEQAPYFIESEYAADGNLVEWAEEQGGIASVPMAERLEIIAQLATALSSAHSVGVLHKDVKPGNVLVSSASGDALKVRLADFGIGAVTGRERLEAAGITVLGLTAKTEDESSSYSGTRLYMAPEVLEGKRATLQADVYALGVMLFQMVVGDFTRALAPGWRRDVEDELVCEDIALAVDGVPERRLGNALRITERLRALEDRRRKREAERREEKRAREVQELLARSKRRRTLTVAAIVVLMLFCGTMAYQASRIAKAAAETNKEAERANREAVRANREAEVAQLISQFMVDLFEVSDPAVTRGNTVTARELLDQGAEKIREGLSEEPLIQARLMDTIGTVYRNLGLYKSAEPLLEKALKIRQGIFPKEHPEIANSLRDVATVYRLQGLNEQAESLYRRSLDILEDWPGTNPSDLVPSLNGLGVVSWRQGRYPEAESIFLRSLEILERAEKSGQQGQSMVAKILNNLALVYIIQGRYREAEPLSLRALKIFEDAHGPESPIVAKVLMNLGDVYRSQERNKEAEEFFRRALDIRESILDSEHPLVASSLNSLAEIHILQGRHREADALYQSALRIWRKALGPEHRSVAVGLNNLADSYVIQGRYEEAEALYRRSLEIFEESLGPDHVYAAFPLQGLASLYFDRRRYSDAESLCQRALGIREKALVPGHPDLQATLRACAKLYRATNREAEAKATELRINAVPATE